MAAPNQTEDRLRKRTHEHINLPYIAYNSLGTSKELSSLTVGIPEVGL